VAWNVPAGRHQLDPGEQGDVAVDEPVAQARSVPVRAHDGEPRMPRGRDLVVPPLHHQLGGGEELVLPA
jgi:hypothetical protein